MQGLRYDRTSHMRHRVGSNDFNEHMVMRDEDEMEGDATWRSEELDHDLRPAH